MYLVSMLLICFSEIPVCSVHEIQQLLFSINQSDSNNFVMLQRTYNIGSTNKINYEEFQKLDFIYFFQTKDEHKA